MSEVRENKPGSESADTAGRGHAGNAPRFRPTTVLGAAGLVLLCLVVYLPGVFTLPPIDRDEARFAQASRQMLESGDWVVPTVQDRPRLSKPPMIYWLQAGSASAFTLGRADRDAVWMYRVPSLLAAIAAVLIIWRLGSSMFDARTGRLGAALFAVCPIVAWEARQSRADMVLVAFTTLAMWSLWEVFGKADLPSRHDAAAPRAGRPHSWRWVLVFWLSLAAGVMTKGPITPMVAFLTIAVLGAFTGRWRWIIRLHPWFGLPLVAVVVAPWVYAVAQRVGWDTYLNTIRDEVLGRSLAPKEGHWGPPGYHAVLLPVLFWPGSLLVGLAVGMAFRQAFEWRGAERGSAFLSRLADAVRGRWAARTAAAPYLFCLAWALPSWLVFELVSTKLPHYTMPLYPALALLSARAVFAAEAGLLRGVEGRLSRAGFAGWLLIGGAMGLVFAAVHVLSTLAGGSAWRILALVLAGLVAFPFIARNIATALASLRERRFLKAQLAGIAAAVFIAFASQFSLPAILGLTSEVAAAVRDVDPEGRRPLAAVTFHEDSLIFLTRGRVERIDRAQALPWLEKNPGGIILAPLGVASDIPGVRPLRSLDGLNYSRGRIEHLTLLERAP